MIPISWSRVCAIAPARFACELLSWAISCFWSAIFRWSARCCACASASSSAWTVVGAFVAGAANSPTRKGIERIARRRWDLRPGRDRGNCWAVAWRVNEQASSSRASVVVSGAAAGYGAREQVHARRIWHRLRGTPETTGSRLPGSVPARATRSAERDPSAGPGRREAMAVFAVRCRAEPDAPRQGDQWAMWRIRAPRLGGQGVTASAEPALYSWAECRAQTSPADEHTPAIRACLARAHRPVRMRQSRLT